MTKSMLIGIVAAVLAAVSWSLSFIVPFVIGDYSLFDFALVEFVLSGLLSVGLLWKNAKAVRMLKPRDWLAACFLGLIGYVGYFLAVMGAAEYAGPVVAPAFLGLVPVVLAVAGNIRERVVAWKVLAWPLVLTTVGLLLVNVSNVFKSGVVETKSLWLGILLSILAVTLWTVFGLMNQTALAKRPQMEGGVWTALIMAGAGLSMFFFLPIGLWLGLFEIPKLGLSWGMAGPLLTWGCGLAIFANVGGAMAWTVASQRLPIALSAQLITMEPISATILGLMVHRLLPSVLEAVGMIVLITGVLIAIGIFTRASGGGMRASESLAGASRL